MVLDLRDPKITRQGSKMDRKSFKNFNFAISPPPRGRTRKKTKKSRNPSKQQKNIEFLILLKISRKRYFPPRGAGRAQKVKKI